MDPATINSATVRLLDAGNVPVFASVTYNAATRTATLEPDVRLDPATTYTVKVTGGATGATAVGGGTMAGDFTSSFTTTQTAAFSIWGPSFTPAIASFEDPNSIELGVRFRSDIDGFITGVRFYKGTDNSGTHTGSLWTTGGTLLATATFTAETGSGWQQVDFSEPVEIAADTNYIASYFAPTGHYSLSPGYFTASGFDNGTIHALQSVAGEGNGVFTYTPVSAFPNDTFGGNNYWVDPVFVPPPEEEPNQAPVAESQSISVAEDAKATILLGATDDRTAPADLTFQILSLPTKGVLKRNGVAVSIGQTFTGSPSNLTYEPGAETQGGAADSFTFKVVDPQGLESAPATVSIGITKAVVDGAFVLGPGGILRIGGTAANDVITVTRTNTGKLKITFGKVTVSESILASAVSEVRVWGRAGADVITMVAMTTPAMLSGGDGNDVLVSGAGNDLLLGGNGDDVLTADGGNDVLVGGDGRDALSGMTGDDVLIAGQALGGISQQGLRTLGAEWVASRTTTAQEAADVDKVVTDDDADVLSGGAGNDWFIINLGDKVMDFTNKVGNKDVITYVS
jgi:Ca2+-binding RTX toxin-like protein